MIDGATNSAIQVAVSSYPVAIAANPVMGKVYLSCYNSNRFEVITGAPWNDTKVRAAFDPLPSDTTVQARPLLTGKGVNRWTPDRTAMMGVGNRVNTTQAKWDWANVTSGAGTDSIAWTYTWGTDSLIMGENWVCAVPLEDQAATTNNLGRGSAFAGNLEVYPVYRIEPYSAGDVGATRILEPTGTIDSGQSVVPACSVYNYGSRNVSYSVSLRIDPFYTGTAMVTNHAPGTSAYATFPAYSDWPRGAFSVTCSTELVGDGTPANDKATGDVTVNVHDVGVSTLLAPTGTVDSATVVTPACTVANYGSVAESYSVRMRIGSFYDDTARIANLAAGTRVGVKFSALTTHSIAKVVSQTAGTRVGVMFPALTAHNDAARVTDQPPGGRTYVTFPTWTANQVGGPYAVTCSTELAGDAQPANDRQSDTVMVTRQVRDVGVLQIIQPVDTVDTGAIVVPTAVVRNFGELEETFPVRFTIGSFYTSDTSVTVGSGATDTVTFREWVVGEVGTHAVRCSTMLDGDQNDTNDLAADTVVVPSVGVRQSENSTVPLAFALYQSRPNPLARGTTVRYALPRPAPVDVRIYDAAGTLVRLLVVGDQAAGYRYAYWNGCDDRGRRVAPGVYYCRFRAGEFRAAQKLVLQR